MAAPPGSSVATARGDWTQIHHFLADLIDIEQIALWQRGGDPDATRPDPVRRPGDLERQAAEAETVPMGMGVAGTVTTVTEFLAMREERARKWRERHGIPEPTPAPKGA